MCPIAQSAHLSALSIPLHAAAIDPPGTPFPLLTVAIAHAVRASAARRGRIERIVERG
jgi:hypothetical protein